MQVLPGRSLSLSKRSKSNNQDIVSLISRYKGSSVVSEIERNLSSFQKGDYPISKLYLSRYYDEMNYDLSSYSALTESIRKDGFLLPLIIVKGEKEGCFEIINGVKRFLIAKSLSMEKVPCILAEIDPERKKVYLIENIVEEGGCPLVKSHAFRLLLEDGYSPSNIAEISHLSISQVRNLIRLDNLSDKLKIALIRNEIQYGEARALLNLPSKTQDELFAEIVEDDISVREIEARKRAILGRQRKRTVVLKGRTVLIHFEDEEEARNHFLKFKKELEN